MTWNSGTCTTAAGGSAFVSNVDGYVRIDDADVRADELDRMLSDPAPVPSAGPGGDNCGDDLGVRR